MSNVTPFCACGTGIKKKEQYREREMDVKEPQLQPDGIRLKVRGHRSVMAHQLASERDMLSIEDLAQKITSTAYRKMRCYTFTSESHFNLQTLTDLDGLWNTVSHSTSLYCNARVHWACIVNQYLKSGTLFRMQWISWSTDLNSVEHLWDMLRRLVHSLPDTLLQAKRMSSLWVGTYNPNHRRWSRSWDKPTLLACVKARIITFSINKSSPLNCFVDKNITFEVTRHDLIIYWTFLLNISRPPTVFYYTSWSVKLSKI